MMTPSRCARQLADAQLARQMLTPLPRRTRRVGRSSRQSPRLPTDEFAAHVSQAKRAFPERLPAISLLAWRR